MALFQYFFSISPIGHKHCELTIEIAGMICVQEMREFVHHHVFDAGNRCFNQSMAKFAELYQGKKIDHLVARGIKQFHFSFFQLHFFKYHSPGSSCFRSRKTSGMVRSEQRCEITAIPAAVVGSFP